MEQVPAYMIARIADPVDPDKKVTTTTDGSKERIDASSKIVFNPYFDGSPLHILSDSLLSTNQTGATYTVPSNKIVYVYQWGASADGTFEIELQIDGVAKDKMYADDLDVLSRGNSDVTYVFPIKATEGQVIRIRKTGGLANKNTASFFSGLEVDE